MSCNNEIRALNYTQRIIQGDSFDVSYTMEDLDTETDISVPIDLSNKTIRGQLRLDSGGDPVTMLTETFDSGSGTVDSFRIQLNSTQTTNMTHGSWRYDVDIVDNSNSELVVTVLKGNFIVRAEMSK